MLKVCFVIVQCSFVIAQCHAKLCSEFVNTAVRDRDTAVAEQPDQLWLGLQYRLPVVLADGL